jgi:hypothetical protein
MRHCLSEILSGIRVSGSSDAKCGVHEQPTIDPEEPVQKGNDASAYCIDEVNLAEKLRGQEHRKGSEKRLEYCEYGYIRLTDALE